MMARYNELRCATGSGHNEIWVDGLHLSHPSQAIMVAR